MGNEPETWHYGIVAQFWAEFCTGGPEIADFRRRVEQNGQPALDLQLGLPLEESKRATYLASFDRLLEMVKILHRANVPLVAGTDALPGLSLLHEIELFVRAGLTPADALRAATIEPARLMKLDKKSGSVASGKTADLVVVDGDPLAQIDDVERVVATIRAGVRFSSAELYDLAGVRHAP